MRLTYERASVLDLPSGETRLLLEFRDGRGRPRALTFVFPRHRFADFCFDLGIPMKYPEIAKARRKAKAA